MRLCEDLVWYERERDYFVYLMNKIYLFYYNQFIDDKGVDKKVVYSN